MNTTDFRAALKRLHLNQTTFADLLGISRFTAVRWANGRGAIPRYASLVLRLLEDKADLMGRLAKHEQPGFIVSPRYVQEAMAKRHAQGLEGSSS